jgi:hypothetical protein
MTALPFSLRFESGRLARRVMGILTVNADGICIEWRADEYRRKLLSHRMEMVRRGEVHITTIAWPVIDAVAYHGSIVGAGTIRIRARTMAAFDELPGADGPFWEAKIASPDRARAREFVLASDATRGARRDGT